jgi:hypothetical protein
VSAPGSLGDTLSAVADRVLPGFIRSPQPPRAAVTTSRRPRPGYVAKPGAGQGWPRHDVVAGVRRLRRGPGGHVVHRAGRERWRGHPRVGARASGRPIRRARRTFPQDPVRGVQSVVVVACHLGSLSGAHPTRCEIRAAGRIHFMCQTLTRCCARLPQESASQPQPRPTAIRTMISCAELPRRAVASWRIVTHVRRPMADQKIKAAAVLLAAGAIHVLDRGRYHIGTSQCVPE